MADVAQLLIELVSVDTQNPGGDEARLARILEARLARFGPDACTVVEVDDHAYVFARWGAPRVLINAHIDTVPAAEGWQQDPHKARIHGDRIVGLGAADTKGAIACLLAAMEEVAPANLAVLFSGDEEKGNAAMDAFLASEDAVGIEQAVVCEPTSCRVGIRHRGILGMRAAVSGPGGHSSRADGVRAPVAELARLAAALHEWGQARKEAGPPDFPGMCMNVARLSGGVAFNVIPDHGELTWSVRPPPGTETRGVRAELEALARDRVPDAEIAVDIENPSFATRDLAAFRPLLGQRVDRPVLLGYWTEAALLAARGIDAVVFGPGDIAVAHAAGEWVPRTDLDTATRCFVSLLHATR